MKHLKTIFACLLMAVLSIGQVWAGEDLYTMNTSGSASTTIEANWTANSNATFNGSGAYWGCTANNNQFIITSGSGITGTVTKVQVTGKRNKAKSYTIDVTVGGSSLGSQFQGTGAASGTSQNYNTNNTFSNSTGLTGTIVITVNAAGGSATADKGSFWITSITVTTADGGSSVTTPTFEPDGGNFVGTQSVTLTQADSKAIYYTTNGDDPTTDGTLYSAPFTLTGTATVKAAAKDGSSWSDVVGKTFTKLDLLTTMDGIFTKATAVGTTATDVAITFNNWVVSGVSTNSKTVFLTDGTKGLMIYDSGASMGFAVGNVLSGTAICKVELKNGSSQLTALNSSTTGLSVATGGTVPLNVLDAAGISALTGVNSGSLIKISGACTSANSKYYVAGVQLYNTLFAFTNPTAGTNYECTGVFQLYGSTKEILPRSAADIVAQVSVATPTFSPVAGEYTEAQTVTITCATASTTIYYTTNGDTPDNTSTQYTGAITVDATQTIKAIAYKGEDHSEVATAAYTINIPIPAHTFQVVHKFETGEGFEFPDGWSTSYAEHEIAYTDDKVVFASANQPGSGSAIDDCPVTKNQAISLVLTNSTKLLSAVRFDYKQWGTKAQTLTMKYSTDGGASYSAFSPAVTSTEFALQVLDLPEGTNAIQVTGSNASNQVGLTKISFDLEDKPIVTKTVTINTPSNGTLVVKNGDDPITSGDAIAVGTTLTIYATPNTDYSLSTISVKDEGNNDVTVNGDNEFDVPNSNVTVSATFVEDVRPAASLTLWENGNEVAFPGDHKQNDHVTLPTTVSHDCANRVFVGWSAVEVAQTNDKPAYSEPGADFVLSAAGVNTLYAVYAAVATPASYQKLESDAFETTATYVIGAEKNSNVEYFYNYASVDANCWGLMSADVATNSPIVFTLSGTAAELVAQDAAGKYLKPVSGNFQMSASEQNFVLADDGRITTASLNLRYNTSYGLRWYNNTTGNSAYFYKVIAPTYNKYSTTCDAAIDAPVFVLPEGTYTEAPQSVTITAAAGATIYYTMTDDGSEPANPTKSSDVYSDVIPLSAAGTYKFKAFAVKGEAESDIASATYTINLPLTTIPDVFAKATAVGSTETEVTVVFNNWVVSGVGGTDNKNVFVTDGTNGFIIFSASHGFAVNDKLSGSVTANLKLYNGAAELLNVKASDLTSVTNDGVVTPVVKTIDQLSGVNTGAPVIVNNVKFNGTNLTDGTNNIKPYTSLYDYTDPSSPFVTNHYYNVTGIYTQFNSTKEILPRSAADIEELAQTAPTMTWYTSSAKTATIAANATYSIDLGDDFAPVFETNSSGTLTYSSNNDAVATINATTGALTLEGGTGDVLITCAVAEDAVNNFTAGSQSFTLRVREGATVDYVVILAQYNGQWYAMKNTGVTSKTAGALVVNYSNGKIWNLAVADQETIKWKRTVDGEGNVTFQAPNDNYLKTSSNDLAQEAGESGVYQWNWNETYYRTGSQTRTFIYRVTANGFKNFAVSNAGTSDYSALPVITAAVFADGEDYTEIRSGLEINRYYTVCLPKQVTAVQGGTFWTLQYRDAGETVVYLEEETAPFAAGKPYIFQATATTLNVVYSGDAVSDPVENGALRGTFTTIAASAFAALPGNVYLLINNKICPRGTGNYLNANRAYIDYDDLTVGTPTPAPGRRVRSMALQGQVATGMDELNAGETPVKVLIDGQLYIIRGEKMYDATGRLVK